MWYWLTDHTKYVYHYTPGNTLACKILANGTLQFSPFHKVNDPREFKDWQFSYHPSGDFCEPALRADLNRRIKHGWRVACFCTDVPEACGPIGHFERGHSRPRMWEQYGENYKGACLIFDREQLDRDIKQAAAADRRDVRSGYVSYEIGQVIPKLGKPDHLTITLHDVNRLGVGDYARLHIERHCQKLFFTKQRDWEHEREYRWMIAGNDTDYLYVDVRESLVGILMGDKFCESYQGAVRKYAMANDVSVAFMDWNNGIPQPRPSAPELLKK